MARLGIGQIGLGGYAQHHREGYRKLGFDVVAGQDPNDGARERFAAEYPEAAVYSHLTGLLEDPNVEVLDVVAPHHGHIRMDLFRQLLEARKPILMQKPMAAYYDEALEMTDLAAAAGVPLMINQSSCFTPAAAALADLILDRQVIGAPEIGQISVQHLLDPRPDSWFGTDERTWTAVMTVDQLGMLQMLFGPPESVYAVAGRDAAQHGQRDGFGDLILRYSSGLAVSINSTGTYYGIDSVETGSERIWFQGERGILDWRPDVGGTLSQRLSDDDDAHCSGEVSADDDGAPRPAGPKVLREPLPSLRQLSEQEALGATMAHFQAAVEAGETPRCSAADNLYVVAVIEAAYRSSLRNEAIWLDELMGDRYDPNYGPGFRRGYQG